MSSKKRSPNQTATAVSMSKDLFDAMESARTKLQMDRSNFIRYCIAKELQSLEGNAKNGKRKPNA